MKIEGFRFFTGMEVDEEELKIMKELIIPEAVPFYRTHNDKDKNGIADGKSIAVCIHGYTATPFEVRPIADKIFEKGIDVVAPLLPAHGIKDVKKAKKELGKITWKIWVKSMHTLIEQLREHYEKVYVYGQSMGGALALEAGENHLVDGIATTAAAIKIPTAAVATWILGLIPINIPQKEEERPFKNISYPFDNSHSILQLLKLSRYVRKNLEKINCPILHCHSHDDELITPKVADMIKNRCSGPVEIKWFDGSVHTMPLHIHGEKIAETIAEFFQRLENE